MRNLWNKCLCSFINMVVIIYAAFNMIKWSQITFKAFDLLSLLQVNNMWFPLQSSYLRV